MSTKQSVIYAIRLHLNHEPSLTQNKLYLYFIGTTFHPIDIITEKHGTQLWDFMRQKEHEPPSRIKLLSITIISLCCNSDATATWRKRM